MSFQAIAGRTGWPMDLLVEGIGALMQPDSYSRNPAHDGRRLIPLVEGRNWGWHVVNHALYREKARLKAQSAAQVADGRNAEKVRRYKERHRQTPEDTTGHPQTPADTLSDSNPNVRKEQHRKRGADTRGSRIPIPFAISEEMRSWAQTETPGIDVDKATAEFVDYWRGVSGQKGCKLDWPATWRNRMREVSSRKATRPRQQERSEWQ